VFGQAHYNSAYADGLYIQQYQPYTYQTLDQYPFSNHNVLLQPQESQQDFDFDLLLLSSDTTNNFNQLQIPEFTEPASSCISNNCQPTGCFNPTYGSTQPTEIYQLAQFQNVDASLVDQTLSLQNYQAYPQQIVSDHTFEQTDKILLNIETDSATEPTQVLITMPVVKSIERKFETLP